jgi:ferredoxin-type protein NapH
MVELFWGHRIWCRALCPLGGMYQVVGVVGLLSVKIDHDACIKCNKCKQACLCDPLILDAAVAGESDRVRSGDCMLCAKCVEACPSGALKISVAAPGRPEL